MLVCEVKRKGKKRSQLSRKGYLQCGERVVEGGRVEGGGKRERERGGGGGREGETEKEGGREGETETQRRERD